MNEKGPDGRISRRRALQVGAVLPAAVLAACAAPAPDSSPTPRAPAPSDGTASNPPVSDPSAEPSPAPRPRRGRVLYRDVALADGRSGTLRLGLSILVARGRIAWIRPLGGEQDPGRARVVDGAGATVVPGLVDGHSHVTGPGGAHWIDRFSDPTERLLAYAEENGTLAWNAGVRWLRDVGSPTRVDPADGRERALAIGIRNRWRRRAGFPTIRAAGTWVTRAGTLPVSRGAEAANADELLAVAMRQLDDGADLVKLYLDGPEPGVAPWSANEVRRVVRAAHGRRARVTAHAGHLDAARVAAGAGVDAIEHGFVLDRDVAALMARRSIMLVSTLTVFRSWLTFAQTTDIAAFAGAGRPAALRTQLARAEESVRLARSAGVAIAAGTDFGGGSARANQLAWEVQSLVAAGLEPWEALGAATWRGGELLGEPDAGVIHEGGPADFFLVHGNPLTDPAALWRVWRHAGE